MKEGMNRRAFLRTLVRTAIAGTLVRPSMVYPVLATPQYCYVEIAILNLCCDKLFVYALENLRLTSVLSGSCGGIIQINNQSGKKP